MSMPEAPSRLRLPGSRRILLPLAAVLVVAALGGCSTNEAELEALEAENSNLRGRLEQTNEALDALYAETETYSATIARLERELADANTVPVSAGPADPFGGIPGVTGRVGAGEVTAEIASDVLFAPGQATLRGQAKRSLDQVIGVLRSDYAGRDIRISGHTDRDPIRKSGFDSNYHLGFERAYAVREHLVSKGIDPERISLASYGPHEPRETKARSRRVEIVVITD